MLGIRRRVLVEMRWRLGDEIMALPVYDAMKTAWPDADIEVLTHYPELIEGQASVKAVNAKNISPDRYIFLRNGSRTDFRVTHYARLAGVAPPESNPQLVFADWHPPLLAELPGETAARIALAPGATWPPKRWADANWHDLAKQLTDAALTPIELGRGHAPVSGAYSLVDRTSVREAACVLHACRLLVSGDCGLMHLALAAGTPVLALFGPTEPSILVRNEPKLHVITNERPCRGCWNLSMEMKEPGVCPRAIPDCLETITPDQVAARVLDLVRTES